MWHACPAHSACTARACVRLVQVWARELVPIWIMTLFFMAFAAHRVHKLASREEVPISGCESCANRATPHAAPPDVLQCNVCRTKDCCWGGPCCAMRSRLDRQCGV